jgi:hypothetical protein
MSGLEEIVVLALAVYSVTAVVAISYVALPLRRGFRQLFALTGWSALVRFGVLESGDEEPIIEDEADRTVAYATIRGFDPISCRLCVGFWVSLIICLCGGHFSVFDVLAVYGLAYAIVTWEKY